MDVAVFIRDGYQKQRSPPFKVATNVSAISATKNDINESLMYGIKDSDTRVN